MPVHESTVGVLLPGPHMQRVERRQLKTIRSFKEMECLSHELRRQSIGMRRFPFVSKDNIVGAEQTQASVWLRFVNHDLRACRIEYAGPVYFCQQVRVQKMESHGPGVRSAHATEDQGVVSFFSFSHILKLGSGVPNNLEQCAGLGFVDLRLRDSGRMGLRVV